MSCYLQSELLKLESVIPDYLDITTEAATVRYFVSYTHYQLNFAVSSKNCHNTRIFTHQVKFCQYLQ
jgi:hypothetical protein